MSSEHWPKVFDDEDMRILFHAAATREHTRKALEDMLVLARECMTLTEIAEIVEETLGEPS